MDKAKILRQCNEIEMIMCEIYNTGHTMQICDYEAVDKRLKAISAEITAPTKTNADRIRQMTDEELAESLSGSVACTHVTGCLDTSCYECSCYECTLAWLKQEVKKDAKSDHEES